MSCASIISVFLFSTSLYFDGLESNCKLRVTRERCIIPFLKDVRGLTGQWYCSDILSALKTSFNVHMESLKSSMHTAYALRTRITRLWILTHTVGRVSVNIPRSENQQERPLGQLKTPPPTNYLL